MVMLMLVVQTGVERTAAIDSPDIRHLRLSGTAGDASMAPWWT